MLYCWYDIYGIIEEKLNIQQAMKFSTIPAECWVSTDLEYSMAIT